MFFFGHLHLHVEIKLLKVLICLQCCKYNPNRKSVGMLSVSFKIKHKTCQFLVYFMTKHPKDGGATNGWKSK